MDDDDLQDLVDDRLYMIVKDRQYARTGKIRGQIKRIGKLKEAWIADHWRTARLAVSVSLITIWSVIT